jgi:hypothetical protein
MKLKTEIKMAKKTKEQLKTKAKIISKLRWEYARRNPYLVAEYDYLILLAKQVLNVPQRGLELFRNGNKFIPVFHRKPRLCALFPLTNHL